MWAVLLLQWSYFPFSVDVVASGFGIPQYFFWWKVLRPG